MREIIDSNSERSYLFIIVLAFLAAAAAVNWPKRFRTASAACGGEYFLLFDVKLSSGTKAISLSWDRSMINFAKSERRIRHSGGKFPYVVAGAAVRQHHVHGVSWLCCEERLTGPVDKLSEMKKSSNKKPTWRCVSPFWF